jgi:hypothetical protein
MFSLPLTRLAQPFLHSMAFTVNASIGEDQPHRVIATTMVAIALSSILTGARYAWRGTGAQMPRHVQV